MDCRCVYWSRCVDWTAIREPGELEEHHAHITHTHTHTGEHRRHRGKGNTRNTREKPEAWL